MGLRSYHSRHNPVLEIQSKSPVHCNGLPDLGRKSHNARTFCYIAYLSFVFSLICDLKYFTRPISPVSKLTWMHSRSSLLTIFHYDISFRSGRAARLPSYRYSIKLMFTRHFGIIKLLIFRLKFAYLRLHTHGQDYH